MGPRGQFIMDGKPTKIIINERCDEGRQAALRHGQTRGCVPRYFMLIYVSVLACPWSTVFMTSLVVRHARCVDIWTAPPINSVFVNCAVKCIEAR